MSSLQMHLFALAEGGTARRLEVAAVPRLLQEKTPFWLDLEGPPHEGAPLLAQHFPFHPLALEDCEHNNTQPKLEEYPDHLFLLLHALNFNVEHYILDHLGIGIFLGASYVVTVHDQPMRSVTAVREVLDKGGKLLNLGVDRVAHAIIDRFVDHYFDAIDSLDERLEELEQRIFCNQTEGILEPVFDTKKQLLAMRRMVAPQREILTLLMSHDFPVIQASSLPYFRDILDHIYRINERIEMNRDLLTGALEIHLTQLSNRMGAVMKTLSIIATIMLPLTFITGVFGMNFKFMPALESPASFWVLLGFMATLSGVLLYIFARKKWM